MRGVVHKVYHALMGSRSLTIYTNFFSFDSFLCDKGKGVEIEIIDFSMTRDIFHERHPRKSSILDCFTESYHKKCSAFDAEIYTAGFNLHIPFSTPSPTKSNKFFNHLSERQFLNWKKKFLGKFVATPTIITFK